MIFEGLTTLSPLLNLAERPTTSGLQGRSSYAANVIAAPTPELDIGNRPLGLYSDHVQPKLGSDKIHDESESQAFYHEPFHNEEEDEEKEEAAAEMDDGEWIWEEIEEEVIDDFPFGQSSCDYIMAAKDKGVFLDIAC